MKAEAKQGSSPKPVWSREQAQLLGVMDYSIGLSLVPGQSVTNQTHGAYQGWGDV